MRKESVKKQQAGRAAAGQCLGVQSCACPSVLSQQELQGLEARQAVFREQMTCCFADNV